MLTSQSLLLLVGTKFFLPIMWSHAFCLFRSAFRSGKANNFFPPPELWLHQKRNTPSSNTNAYYFTCLITVQKHQDVELKSSASITKHGSGRSSRAAWKQMADGSGDNSGNHVTSLSSSRNRCRRGKE
ncbi:hypothetical protein ISCGN_009611 [Ixodes scapularis]